MQQIKESLIETAGNLDEAQQRIIRNVNAGLHTTPSKKRPTYKWVTPIALSFVLLAFILSIPILKNEITTASYTKQELFANYKFVLDQMTSTDKELTQFEYIATMSVPYLVDFYQIEINDKEMRDYVQAQLALYEDSSLHEMNIPHYDKISFVNERMLEASYMLEQLEPIYEKMYPSISSHTIHQLMQLDAIHQFKQSEDVPLFATNAQLDDMLRYLRVTPTVSGTVIHTTEDCIVVTLNSNVFGLLNLSIDQVANFNDVIKVPVKNNVYIVGQSVNITYYGAFNYNSVHRFEERIATNIEPVASYIALEAVEQNALKTFFTELEWHKEFASALGASYETNVGTTRYTFVILSPTSIEVINNDEMTASLLNAEQTERLKDIIKNSPVTQIEF
jgi:hypothetical protein